MNTIKSLTERTLRIINSGAVPRDSRFKDRDIEYMLRDCLGTLILQAWGAGRNIKEAVDVSDSFVVTVTKSIQTTQRGDCYIDLDFDWVNIPDGTGVRAVRPSVEATNPLTNQLPGFSAFIPIPERFFDIFKNLPAQALEGQIGWALRGKKIWLTDLYGQSLIDLGIESCDIDVISTSENVLGLTSPMPITSDMAEIMISKTVQFFMPGMSVPKDTLNDNNPNTKPIKS